MVPATRKQYGANNYSEGGVPDYFDDYETALRDHAEEFNTGKVYERPKVRRNGVLPNDNGIMPTRNMWYGVIHAVLRPVGITPGQTYLAQGAANTVAWAGDTPVDMQPQFTRAAPWRRGALSPARVNR